MEHPRNSKQRSSLANSPREDSDREAAEGDFSGSKAPVQVTADDLADEEWGPVKEKKGGKKGKKGKKEKPEQKLGLSRKNSYSCAQRLSSRGRGHRRGGGTSSTCLCPRTRATKG